MDSKIVFGYVNNEVRRFYVYVVNCVQQIRDFINLSLWMYVDIESNFVDYVFCGFIVLQLLQGFIWLFGLEFFWKEGVFKFLKEEEIKVKEDDFEVKKGNVFMFCVVSVVVFYFDLFKLDCLVYILSWWCFLKVVVLCL